MSTQSLVNLLIVLVGAALDGIIGLIFFRSHGYAYVLTPFTVGALGITLRRTINKDKSHGGTATISR